jgi:hypothetical protein
VRHKRGKYALAIHDFKHALSLVQSDTTTTAATTATSANVTAIQALLDKSMSKYEEVEGKPYSTNNDSNDNNNDNNNDNTSNSTDTQVCTKQ